MEGHDVSECKDPVRGNYKLPEAARVLNCSLNHVRNLMDSGVLKRVQVGLRASRVSKACVDSLAAHGLTAAQAKLLKASRTGLRSDAE
jgi:excisionase family DNA binding protein